VLVAEELVTSDDIALALAERQEGERIGETLVRLGYLTQRQLVGAVAKQIGAVDGSGDDLIPTKEALALVSLADAQHRRILPLRIEPAGSVVAVDDEPSAELRAFLEEHMPTPLQIVLVEPRCLLHAIERSYTFGDDRRKPLGAYLVDRGMLTRPQLEEILIAQDHKHKPLFQLVIDAGHLTSDQIADVQEHYFK
jgi:type IV pilus assembly protein PilB